MCGFFRDNQLNFLQHILADNNLCPINLESKVGSWKYAKTDLILLLLFAYKIVSPPSICEALVPDLSYQEQILQDAAVMK